MNETFERIANLPPKKLALLAWELQSKLQAMERARREPIAIIGIGCRFPAGADSPEAFWRLLWEGRDAITEVPRSRWEVDAYYDPDPDAPGKMSTRFGAFLNGVDQFDPQFFGIAPREAQSMDPQQRLLLEVAWEALEHAGQSASKLHGTRTSVYLGISGYDYYLELMRSGDPSVYGAYLASGSAHSVASGRLSYLLGLHGPSLSVDTACSSSLVAVHLACQGLRAGDCQLALAGGVNLILAPDVTITLSKTRMMAPDGRCKAFDASADGFVRGEGCGVVVLKRLADAQAAGDPVLAVIRGTAINQDGRSSGLTAPNGPAQEDVIRRALADASVEAERVGYVETHGTGTSLGDPIEVQALGAILAAGRGESSPLLIGSVKTNIGHLESAAGVAGLIKLVLALQHEVIPSHLHFKDPNPHIPWERLAVRVATERTPWPGTDRPRVGTVSSFGFSGTNAHVVVEEAPVPAPARKEFDRPLHLLTLSAQTEAALRELTGRYAERLSEGPSLELADICYTAASGRTHFPHRLALISDTGGAARTSLAGVAAGHAVHGVVKGRAPVSGAPPIAFLFTGQGSQYVGMGRELYETSPTFRKALERCDELLRSDLDRPLLSVLYPEGEASPMDQTAYTQPALFALEWALAELWRSWGIEPTAVLGHSVGEYVAACVAGVFSLEEGLRLIAARARLMQALPPGGAMAAVFADEARVREAVAPYRREVSLAAINGPENVVISGTAEAVRAVLESLAAAGIKGKPLTVSHAFHSPLMEPMLAEFARMAAGKRAAAPRVGLVSNLTGELVKPGDIDAAYWVRHVREPVRFQAGMEALKGLGYQVFLELGPSSTLLGMGRRCLPDGYGVWLPTLRKGRGDWEQMLPSLGELYVHGAEVDWAGFDRDYTRRKVALPTYPFQRERYWLEGGIAPRGRSTASPVSRGADIDTQSIDDWLYTLAWQPQAGGPAAASRPATPGSWLILADSEGVGAELAALLEQHGERCRLVYPGGAEKASRNGQPTIDPARPEEFAKVLKEVLGHSERPCRGVIHLWALDSAREEPTVESLRRAQTLGCGGALHLVQALARAEGAAPPRLWLVTRGAQAVGAAPAPLAVGQAPLWGLGRTIAQEHPTLHCVRVDLDTVGAGTGAPALLRELCTPGPEDQVAFRGEDRYVARLVRAAATEPTRPGPGIRSEGAYLITGGLGGLGLTVARWLVAQGARNLVLLGRREPTAEAREAIAEMEAQGARVRALRADVSRPEDITRVLAEIAASLPPLRGIVHAAGVLDDGVLLEQDLERFATVMAPKVAGAWTLHTHTQRLPLDFFVLFSSGASLLGSPGQGNYAAANAFLDALAHHRRALGLPALSINWGPWAEVGMAARLRDQDQRRHMDQGVGLIPPAQGVQVLGELLRQRSAQVGVLIIDWTMLLGQVPVDARSPVYSRVALESPARQNADPGATPRHELLRQLEEVPPGKREAILLAHVQEQVVKVLGLNPSRPPGQQEGLTEIGMDSLMAVELRKRLEASVARSLPATLAFENPTIEAISAYLSKELFPREVSVPTPRASQDQDGQARIEADLEGLSREEMEASLLAELDQAGY